MNNMIDEIIDDANSFAIREYLGITKEVPHEWENIFKDLESGIVPEEYPKVSEISMMGCHIRDVYNDNYSFPLIGMNWVRALKGSIIKDGKCLEVLSGAGLLSYALKSIGADIIATDNNDWADNTHDKWKNFSNFIDIERIDAVEAVKKYGKDVDFIIMSWPPYLESIANEVLIEMRKVNPECMMIYIGEDYGGCTADDDFYNNMKYVDDRTMQVALSRINDMYQRFPGIHDEIKLLK